jgi:hypothetical protein
MSASASTTPAPKIDNTRPAVYTKLPAVVVTDVDRPRMANNTYEFIMCEAMNTMFTDAAKPKADSDKAITYLYVPEATYGRRKSNPQSNTRTAERAAAYNNMPQTDMVLPTFSSSAQQRDKRAVYATAMSELKPITANNKPTSTPSNARAAVYQSLPEQSAVTMFAPTVSNTRAAAYATHQSTPESPKLASRPQSASISQADLVARKTFSAGRAYSNSVSDNAMRKTFSAGSVSESMESLIRSSARANKNIGDMTRVPSVSMMPLHEDVARPPVRLQRIINLGNIAQLQKFAC